MATAASDSRPQSVSGRWRCAHRSGVSWAAWKKRWLRRSASISNARAKARGESRTSSPEGEGASLSPSRQVSFTARGVPRASTTTRRSSGASARDQCTGCGRATTADVTPTATHVQRLALHQRIRRARVLALVRVSTFGGVERIVHRRLRRDAREGEKVNDREKRARRPRGARARTHGSAPTSAGRFRRFARVGARGPLPRAARR